MSKSDRQQHRDGGALTGSGYANSGSKSLEALTFPPPQTVQQVQQTQQGQSGSQITTAADAHDFD
ncbi:hypothetical protein [Nocardia farcinica]|uniref:hypothetical protein n=1 Tax=Nocardia farcinica TaxID=37329 RepID=UPI001895722E|nr:hypothetical protein [Nocardia farcinica]MBF6522819.1 hypothetical protein [Nocardia farcinica]